MMSIAKDFKKKSKSTNYLDDRESIGPFVQLRSTQHWPFELLALLWDSHEAKSGSQNLSQTAHWNPFQRLSDAALLSIRLLSEVLTICCHTQIEPAAMK